MQNEMIKVMGLSIVRKIASNIRSSPFYTIMVDETTDMANIEQVVVCLRWVNEIFEVQEEFVGLYQVESVHSEKIYQVITDILLRLNLCMSKIRGQCYNGASVMTGVKSGVVARVRGAHSWTEVPRSKVRGFRF